MEAKLDVYDIYCTMVEHHILLIYQGMFDQEMVKSFLLMTEKKLMTDNIEEATRKKLFNVMMEGLQNICKHQLTTSESDSNPFFIIGKNGNCFNVVTGNMIENSRVDSLKNKIDHINTLNPEELKSLYKQTRINSVISEVGGAGLGFIDMARKSGNKLEYRFYPLSANYSYFILNNRISNN